MGPTDYLVKALAKAAAEPPSDRADYAAWIAQNDVVPLLEHDSRSEAIIVYVSLPHAFIHTAVVKQEAITPPDEDDLLSWGFHPSSSWGLEYSGSDPPELSISDPYEVASSEALKGAEQLVFIRHFEGRIEQQSYIEILQKFAHVFELHFVPERNAYCKFNNRGDLEDYVKVVNVPGVGQFYGGEIVLVSRRILDEYLVATKGALIRMFDFTRFRRSSFSGWRDGSAETVVRANELAFRLRVEAGHASYSRGYQIIRPNETAESVIRRLRGLDQIEPKRYATFIAQDFKHNEIREISCSPEALGNYFVESDLPFGTSPAFFRSDVLLKYKADPDKYHLTERSLTCRNAWHLETYDINDAGQVHSYLYTLGASPMTNNYIGNRLTRSRRRLFQNALSRPILRATFIWNMMHCQA